MSRNDRVDLDVAPPDWLTAERRLEGPCRRAVSDRTSAAYTTRIAMRRHAQRLGSTCPAETAGAPAWEKWLQANFATIGKRLAVGPGADQTGLHDLLVLQLLEAPDSAISRAIRLRGSRGRSGGTATAMGVPPKAGGVDIAGAQPAGVDSLGVASAQSSTEPAPSLEGGEQVRTRVSEAVDQGDGRSLHAAEPTRAIWVPAGGFSLHAMAHALGATVEDIDGLCERSEALGPEDVMLVAEVLGASVSAGWGPPPDSGRTEAEAVQHGGTPAESPIDAPPNAAGTADHVANGPKPTGESRSGPGTTGEAPTTPTLDRSPADPPYTADESVESDAESSAPAPQPLDVESPARTAGPLRSGALPDEVCRDPAGGAVNGWRTVLLDAAGYDHPEQRHWLGAAEPTRALAAERSRLEAEQQQIAARIAALPQEGDLAETIEHVDGLATTLASLECAPRVLPSRPGVLSAVDRLLTKRADSLFDQLPAWIPGRGDPASVLGELHVVDSLEECLRWVRATFGDAGSDVLRTLPAGPGRSAAERLRSAWERFADLRRRLGIGDDDEMHDVLATCSETELESIAASTNAWRPLLHPTAWRTMWARLPHGIESWLTAFNPDFLDCPNAGTLRYISALDEGLKVLENDPVRSSRGDRTSVRRAGRAPSFEIDHVVSEEKGGVRAAHILLSRPREGVEGFFWMPFRVKATERWAGELRIRIEGEFLRSLAVGKSVAPPDKPVRGHRDSSGRVFSESRVVAPEDWAAAESGYHLDISMRVPIHRSSLDVTLKRGSLLAQVAVEGGRQVAQKGLTYSSLAESAPEFRFEIKDYTEIHEMLEMPLGVQEHLPRLESLLGSKSFLVVAPRRFGKSTLFRALVDRARARRDLVVAEVSVNRPDRPQDAAAEVRKQIFEQLKAQRYPIAPLPELDLNDPETYRAVLFAIGTGKTLCVFVDEAQALVPHGDDGIRWGSALKRLVEAGQPIRSDPRAAKIAFIFVGTLGLEYRLGDDAAAFFNVQARTLSFDEESLARFIRVRTRGALESSADARRTLAKISNNLFTLHVILAEISATAARDGRTYFLTDEVVRAAEALARRERQSPGALSTYLTSELSKLDEKWQPVDGYPVAVALARVDVSAPQAAVQEATRWLNDRLKANGWPGSIVPDRVESGIRELQRLGVLDGDGIEFRHPVLRSLLKNRGDQAPFRAAEDRDALERLSLDLLRVPKTAVPRGSGGQAQVFVLTEGASTRAWRVCSIGEQPIRRRFLQTCAAIRILREVGSRIPEDNLLPRVIAAGLDENDPNKGIMTYDWVAGEELQSSWAVLPELARVHVVEQVAGALVALSRRQVVHRDVNPRNIIVDARLQARLIDFGLAAIASEGLSRGGGSPDFIAPDRNPSFPADVWSLGRILAGPAGGCEHPKVRALVEAMTQEDPSARPTAAVVRSRLREVLEQGFNADLSIAQKHVADGLAHLPQSVKIALTPFQEAIAFRRARFTRWDDLRAITAAHALNSVFACWEDAYRDAQWTATPALGRIRKDIATKPPARLKQFVDKRVHAVGLLRNAAGHPEEQAAILADAERELGPGKDRLVRFQEALQHTLGLLDQLTGASGRLSSFLLPLIES